ncbi:MAG: hypothetical protein KA186_11120 [Flavobacteriales bacterium]|nr:hypothetical protein [Flavobacteriales bacterium]
MRRVFPFVVLLHLGNITIAQVSPYTGLAVVPPDSTGSYRLLIGGHFHGASSNTSGFPAATLLANIGTLNATNANVFLSTGDLFLRPDRDSVRYTTALFEELKLPLFNAPGNHDLEGSAYHSATRMPVMVPMGGDRIILLDTERDNSDVSGDQLQQIIDAEQAATEGHLRHLFIISHRPVWSEGEPKYGDLFRGNTRSLTGSNFKKDVLPVLQRIAQHANVYWISGSMAGRAPASIFFQEHEQGITFIQSAIRDELRDAVLIADVSKLPSSSGEGEGVRPPSVKWTGLSLTGQPLEPVQSYDAAWWKAHQGTAEPFAWRRIPYLIKKTVTNLNYWYGFGTAVLLLLLGWRIRR